MVYQNFFATKLTNDIGAADTSIVVDQAPTATSGRLVLEARNPTQREIIKYTGVAGNQLTGVTRGVGGTTAKSHLKNALIEMNLTAEDIADLYAAFASFSAANGNGWLSLASTITYNQGFGQREWLLNSSVDVSSFISKGDRLRLTRPSAAPTQSMLFNGSTQYATKATPSGLNFANTFTIESWMYNDSTSNGASRMWLSRTNTGATDGWYSQIDASGRLTIVYTSGGNATGWYTKEAIPSGEWVHVAIVVSSISGKTLQGIYLNGYPVYTVNNVNTSTTITNSGNLTLGRWDNPNQYWGGALSEVRIWSTARTATQIVDNMYNNLVGNETGLIGLWRGDGSWNDLTANANHLTATGAVNNNLNNPFNTREHLIVTNVTSSTIRVISSKKGGVPNLTYSAVDYSKARAPYGFPSDRSDWTFFRQLIDMENVVASGNTAGGTWREINFSDTAIPGGAWRVRYAIRFIGSSPGTAQQTWAVQLTPLGVTPFVDSTYSRTQFVNRIPTGVTDGFAVASASGETNINLASQTVLKMAGVHTAGAATTSVYYEIGAPAFIIWESNYL